MTALLLFVSLLFGCTQPQPFDEFSGVRSGSAQLTADYVTAVPEDSTSGFVPQGQRDNVFSVPAGVRDVTLRLSSAYDNDLELWHGNTHVVGWHGIIDSSGYRSGAYNGDSIETSGWNGGNEYIRIRGAVRNSYQVKVFGYEGGGYTVTYEKSSGGTPPPSDCHQSSPGSYNYCSSSCQCAEGEGDCDEGQNQCQSGLTCATDVGPSYGWESWVDVCVKSHTTITASYGLIVNIVFTKYGSQDYYILHVRPGGGGSDFYVTSAQQQGGSFAILVPSWGEYKIWIERTYTAGGVMQFWKFERWAYVSDNDPASNYFTHTEWVTIDIG